MLISIASTIIPIIIISTVIFGLIEKKDVLKLFTDGVIEGLRTILKIFPSILAIIVAVNLITSSGAIDIILMPIKPILTLIGIPKEILPLTILRPLSGSASMGVLMELIAKYGADSVQGKMASIIMSSSDTTFYVIAMFFGTIGIKKGKGTVISAIVADISAIMLTLIMVKWNIF